MHIKRKTNENDNFPGKHISRLCHVFVLLLCNPPCVCFDRCNLSILCWIYLSCLNSVDLKFSASAPYPHSEANIDAHEMYMLSSIIWICIVVLLTFPGLKLVPFANRFSEFLTISVFSSEGSEVVLTTRNWCVMLFGNIQQTLDVHPDHSVHKTNSTPQLGMSSQPAVSITKVRLIPYGTPQSCMVLYFCLLTAEVHVRYFHVCCLI